MTTYLHSPLKPAPGIDLARFHKIFAVLHVSPGCCTVCSIYFAIKWMDPKYLGPPPGESCKDADRCRNHARRIFQESKQ
jgi:hypothetical protein